MKEMWKDIKDYEGLYQGSNLGRARSLDRWVKSINGSVRFYKGRILKPFTTKNGYPARPTLGKKGFWEASEKEIERVLDETMMSFFEK